MQQKGLQPEGNLRGKFESDAKGGFWFRSVRPRDYPIPDDGPVGKLLATLGRHPNRAAHIHFMIQAPGFETVITHIFSPDCPYLAEDTVFGVKQSLVGEFERVDDAAAPRPPTGSRARSGKPIGPSCSSARKAEPRRRAPAARHPATKTKETATHLVAAAARS